MLQTALDALARRDADAALAAARAATQAEPDRAEAHHALGAALQLGGQLSDAAEAYDRAIALAPQQAQFHIARAALALGQRDLGAASAALGDAVAHDPNALTAYVMNAHMALARGELEQAEQQLKLARRVNPEHPLTLTVEGNLALARGDQETAQRSLHKAAELAPDEPLVLSSLALSYLAAGNLAFAAQSLRRALQAQPDASHLRLMLLQTLRQLGHFDELVAEIEPLLAREPDNWRALNMLADAHLRLGTHDQALDAYRRALAAPAAPAHMLGAIINALSSRGLAEHARGLLDELLQDSPGDDLLWAHRLAVVDGNAGDFSLHIEKWLRAVPDSALAMQARATLAEQTGALDAAEAAADIAIARDPMLFDAALIKLRATLRRDPASAIERADALFAIVADPPTRRLCKAIRGFALDRLERHAEAVADWAEGAAILGNPIPLPPNRPAVTAAPEASGAGAHFLWGLPGSQVFAVATLLRSVPGLHLLDDRFGTGSRPDGLWPPRADGSVATPTVWRSFLERRGFDIAQVVDWLPHWDECIASALPEARLLVVLDDPRDLLLNWFVFGAPQAGPQPPEHTARWLAQVLEPLAKRIEHGDPRICRVGGEALATEPEAVAARLRGFFSLAAEPRAETLANLGIGPGGLPSSFPPGHWRHYAEPLAAAFALLAPVAQRLGYPAA
jgi:tetratricopeptide (TPR) repeat protein